MQRTRIGGPQTELERSMDHVQDAKSTTSHRLILARLTAAASAIQPEIILSHRQTPLDKHLEAVFLQLDFPAFLGERTRAAEPGHEDIANRISTSAIALTDLFTGTNLKQNVYIHHVSVIFPNITDDLTLAGDIEPNIDEAFNWLSYVSSPPARGVCRLCRRCLFLPYTTHEHQTDQQPTVKEGQVIKT
jgi:hypothetical protein